MTELAPEAWLSDAVHPFIWPELPSLGPDDLLLSELLPSTPQLTRFRFGSDNQKLTFPGEVSRDQLTLRTEVHFGTMTLDVWTAPELTTDALTARGYDLDPAGLGADSAALVVEYLLFEVLAPLEAAFGEMSIVSHGPTTQVPPSLLLAFTLHGVSDAGFAVSAPLETLKTLIGKFDTGKSGGPGLVPKTYAVPMTLLGPQLEVTRADIDDLAPGDGLVLAEDRIAADIRSISVGDGLLAAAEIQSGKLVLASALTRNPNQRKPEHRNTDMPNQIESGDEIGALPVVVNLELARTEVSLSELQKMSNGSILPFDCELPDTVRLLVEGDIVAEGDLVKMGDKIAVRLTKVG